MKTKTEKEKEINYQCQCQEGADKYGKLVETLCAKLIKKKQ